MKTKPISSKGHALIDYAFIGSILALPSLLKMNKQAKLIYAVEAALLLPYAALTKQPLAVKGLIPFKMHGKIDPINIVQFAAQSFLPAFRKNRKELIFNITITALGGLAILLTDWKSSD
jgi:hypothetical protein